MDNNLLHKIMTYKSGKFVFSMKYNTSELQNLLYEAKLLYTTIADLPILPEWAAYLEEELIRRSIFSTAALEGNPLKEDEVGNIIKQNGGSQKDSEAKQTIINLNKVYGSIKKVEPSNEPHKLTEDYIKNIHGIITADLSNSDNVPGQYRNHIVRVGDGEHGGTYTPPKCLPDIKKLMSSFVNWINSEEVIALDSLIRAALAHYHLGLIHPFGNGNGRTIRIIEAMLLRSSGIKYVPTMLSNYYYRNMDNYYLTFSITRGNSDHDITAFLKFMLEGVVESLKEIKDNVTFRIRLLVMRDYYAFLRSSKTITQRQHDLVCMLLELVGRISLKDLFSTPPYNTLYRNVSERTARRDINKLFQLGVLSQDDDHYILNIKAVG